ncbi:hypothetical protein AGMMS49965_18000 [Bacteroidia bacterium]|nr:hypothetical protein AGMMS49965_18000 [Bacteroidia bacterium]
MNMEATVNGNYTDAAHGYSISFANIRRWWYRFLERCEDHWDAFTIWMRRNDETYPLEDVMKEEFERRGLKYDV